MEKTMWRVTYHSFDKPNIQELVVDHTTEYFVVLPGDRTEMKNTTGVKWFDDRGEAKAFLVRILRDKVLAAKNEYLTLQRELDLLLA